MMRKRGGWMISFLNFGLYVSEKVRMRSCMFEAVGACLPTWVLLWSGGGLPCVRGSQLCASIRFCGVYRRRYIKLHILEILIVDCWPRYWLSSSLMAFGWCFVLIMDRGSPGSIKSCGYHVGILPCPSPPIKDGHRACESDLSTAGKVSLSL